MQPLNGFARVFNSPRVPSGTRRNNAFISAICRATCAAAGAPPRASKRSAVPSNKCNGMTYDGAGNLYVCEHVTSSVVMETPAAGARCWPRTGRAGNSTVRTTSWSGPTTPSTSATRPTAACRASASSARRISISRACTASRRTAQLHLEAADFGQPNGLCFSPDEKSAVRERHDARAHPRVRRGRRTARSRTAASSPRTSATASTGGWWTA